MTCSQMEGQILELASGATASAAVSRHLRECPQCAAQLGELRSTMALLDEWQAPEPSPYFDTRLRARLREESARAPHAWLAWLRKPALAVAMAGLMVLGITMFQAHHSTAPDMSAAKFAPAVQNVPPGTAVADLQQLDKNYDLYANFDILDDLADQQQNGDSQPTNY